MRKEPNSNARVHLLGTIPPPRTQRSNIAGPNSAAPATGLWCVQIALGVGVRRSLGAIARAAPYGQRAQRGVRANIWWKLIRSKRWRGVSCRLLEFGQRCQRGPLDRSLCGGRFRAVNVASGSAATIRCQRMQSPSSCPGLISKPTDMSDSFVHRNGRWKNLRPTPNRFQATIPQNNIDGALIPIADHAALDLIDSYGHIAEACNPSASRLNCSIWHCRALRHSLSNGVVVKPALVGAWPRRSGVLAARAAATR